MIEPARFTAHSIAAAGKPAYVFRFSYVAESMRKQWPGAPHATEIPFVFDTVAARYGKDLTPKDEATAQAANAYWVSFARTGNPNGPGLPEWSTYSPETEKLMDFTLAGPVGKTDPWKARLDVVEKLANQPDRPTARKPIERETMKTHRNLWIGGLAVALLSASVYSPNRRRRPSRPNRRAGRGAGRGPQAPRIVSPEIHPDKTVTFRLSAPKAEEVTLNGSWDGATNLPMTKGADGVWTTTVGPLGDQLWGYWFMVDGVKALDPGNGETQRDGVRYDNLLMIAGPADDLWDFKDVPHGTVQEVWYPSPTLKEDRPPHVYLHSAGLRNQQDQVSRAVPAARRRRRRRRVDHDGPRADHHGQPDRGRQGQADDRGHAERQRHPDGFPGLRLRSHAGAPAGAGAGAAADSGGSGRTGNGPRAGHAGAGSTRTSGSGRGRTRGPGVRRFLPGKPGEGRDSVRREDLPRNRNKDSRAIAGLSMGAGHTVSATNNNPGVFGYIGVFSGGGQVGNPTFESQLQAVKKSRSEISTGWAPGPPTWPAPAL